MSGQGREGELPAPLLSSTWLSHDGRNLMNYILHTQCKHGMKLEVEENGNGVYMDRRGTSNEECGEAEALRSVSRTMAET